MHGTRFMAGTKSNFEEQFSEATRRGEKRLSSDPCAIGARYDRRQRVVIIDLNSGCSLLIPPELAQGLSQASPDELAEVSIRGPGTTVAWPKLDVQFSVTALLSGVLGTRAWMAELTRHAKVAANLRKVRRNGTRSSAHRGTKRVAARSVLRGQRSRSAQ